MTDIYLSIEQFAAYEGITYNTMRAKVSKLDQRHVLPPTGRGRKGGALLSTALLSPEARRRFLGDPQAAAIAAPLPPSVPTLNAASDAEAADAPVWLSLKTASEFWQAGGQSVCPRTLRRWCAANKISGWRKNTFDAYEIRIDALPEAAQIAYYLRHGLDLPARLRKGCRKTASSLDELSADQRQAALRMAERLRDFERVLQTTGWSKTAAARAFCETEEGLKAAKLLSAYRKWLKAGRDISVLAPKAKPGRPLAPIHRQALRWLYEHYCDSPLPNKRLSAKATIAKARIMSWQPIPGVSTLERYLTRMPANVRIARQGGAKALDDLYLPATLRSYEFPAMEIWVGDHHQFDVMVRLGNRPVRLWVTAWMDMKSRMFVGWQIVAQPNSTSVAQSFYRGVTRHGSPKTLLIDNGKDYVCYKLIGTRWQKRRKRLVDEANGRYLTGAFEACGIQDVCRAIEYNAESKNIERAFRTHEAQFCAQLPGYCGRSTVERKRLEERLGHKIEASPNLLSAEEFIAKYERYITEIYHQQVHTGEGMREGMNNRTPAQCMAQERDLAQPGFVPEENLAVLFLTPQQVTIQRQGFYVMGQWFRSPQLQHTYFDPQKSKEERKMIARIDEADLTSIRIYDGKTDCFVGLAPLVGKAAFRSKDEIERRKHEHKELKALRDAWWKKQEKLLDGDITPAERICLNEETARAVVNAGPQQGQGQGKDDKVTRIVPNKMGDPKARKQAVQAAATTGAGLVRQGPQTGAQLIDLATVQQRVRQAAQPQRETPPETALPPETPQKNDAINGLLDDIFGF